MKQWISALLLLVVGSAGLAWYVLGGDTGVAEHGPAGGWKMPPPSVEAASVVVGTVVRSVEAVGTLRANEAITLRPEISGRVVAIHFDEGQPVQRGAALISLDDSVYQAEYLEKQADLRIAELAYARAEKLVKNRAAPVEERDRTLAHMQAAEAALQLAKAHLDKTRILAPFAGTMGLRAVSPGDYVAEGEALVSLVEINPLKVDFRVGEIYLSQVAVGQAIAVRVDSFPGETFNGSVYAIEPQVDISGRSVVIRATLPNTEQRLRPGLFSRVDLIVDAAADAILIPEDAVVPRGEQHFAYRLEADHVLLTEIKLGKRAGSQVEVRSGLTRDSVVITAGQLKLRDGVQVQVVADGEDNTAEKLSSVVEKDG